MGDTTTAPHHSPLQCIFAANVAPYVQTPMFALQPRFDSWQVDNELAVDHVAADDINEYGTRLTGACGVCQSFFVLCSPSLWCLSAVACYARLPCGVWQPLCAMLAFSVRFYQSLCARLAFLVAFVSRCVLWSPSLCGFVSHCVLCFPPPPFRPEHSREAALSIVQQSAALLPCVESMEMN